jgi:hypothetical protein
MKKTKKIIKALSTEQKAELVKIGELTVFQYCNGQWVMNHKDFNDKYGNVEFARIPKDEALKVLELSKVGA